ncbi:hypothetical protein F5B22DRAFT_650294 [Xylaria bambusicola]|uniref:uncharacterized protein n=1 Tax=Xylaria bambusicola TaxID=326684 RepID=UPI00200739BF|nr:uncharacterized protein F5B22DRAFT_650294 [Xylaria bambusicola]KAI0506811.1 hypothetical protein F5B22DRAFT_650294 [Xylaria bambusicola]
MASPSNVKPYSSWVQEGEHRYTQLYGFQEVLYNAISAPPGSPALFLPFSHVTFKHVKGGDRLSDHSLALCIRIAWLQLRQNHPQLAAVNLREAKTYISPSSRTELEEWLDATFIVLPETTANEIWRNAVKPRQLTLYFLPQERQLCLLGEHHTIDGRGLMNFWDRLFRALGSPQPDEVLWKTDGSEVSRLPPRSDDLLNLEEKSPGCGVLRAREMLLPLKSPSPIHLPIAEHQLARPFSRKNASVELRLSVAMTRAIVSTCKRQRLGVTAAWHAAIILATQTTQANYMAPGTQFSGFANIDLRRYFPPSSVDAYVFNNHSTILPFSVRPNGKSFTYLAREINNFLSRDLSSADPEVWSALGPMIQSLVPGFTVPHLTDTTPAVSSLGIIDTYIASSYPNGNGRRDDGYWEIEHVWFGDTVCGPWLECFMWSWQDQISLNTVYNPAYHTHVEVDKFLQVVVEKFMDGLGIIIREGDGMSKI